MKKLLKSKKALSPVVAAIILIAVTVAVSIAVAAWMGALTFTFMKTEQLKYTNVKFGGVSGNGTNYVNVTVQNTGTSDMVLTEDKITGFGVAGKIIDFTDVPVAKGASTTIKVTNVGWTYGYPYDIELHSSNGNKFPTTENAPQ